jgi:hypothetical protein
MTAETVTFEGIVPAYGMVDQIDTYAGFAWRHVGVADKARNGGDTNGYQAVVHDDAYAFNTSATRASFSSTTTFTLESGHFAAAWNVGLTVMVKGYLDGVKIAHQTFILDQVDTLLTFDKHFAHVDRVMIKSFGGTDGTGAGQGTHVGFDNLQVTFDGDIPPDGAHVAGHGGSDAAMGLVHMHDAVHGQMVHATPEMLL